MLRKALDDFEESLLGPDVPSIADVEVTPELEGILQTLPRDEVRRLSEVVPQLAEVKEAEPPRRPRRKPR
jgi:hypothetical protein